MYNPSDVGKKGTLFGLPYSIDEADLIILPVGLDITVSYGQGTSQAPDLILHESSQLDLSLPEVVDPWKLKVVQAEGFLSGQEIVTHRDKAKTVIDHLEAGGSPEEKMDLIENVNGFCEELHQQVESRCNDFLDQGKRIGIVGGDHSSPYGYLKALAKREKFGILQIDAHMDLREAYEGFTYSHASIMYNAMQLDNVESLTQIGIRDYCEEEEDYVEKSSKKIHTFFDALQFEERAKGKSWSDQVKGVISTLPDSVYISFDIDCLEPSLCPNTGTPVPGGLKYNEAVFLINEVVRSGRKIVGFDLCEVGNDAWDANVGARVLYRLSTALGVSQNLLTGK